MSKWLRLSDAEVRRLKNIGFGEEGPIGKTLFIVYRQKGTIGASWPRLVLSVSISPFEAVVRVNCSIKKKPGSWWEETRGIPHDLVPHVIPLLEKI